MARHFHSGRRLSIGDYKPDLRQTKAHAALFIETDNKISTKFNLAMVIARNIKFHLIIVS